MAATVRSHIDGAVARVTLDAPERLNAVSVAMWRELARTFSEIGRASCRERV